MNTKQFCSICLLLQTVFITPIASFPSSKSETPDIRQCVDIKDYDIYNWLIDDGNYGIIDFPKQEVDSLLMKDECGLTESGEVKKVLCPMDDSNNENIKSNHNNGTLQIGTRTVYATAEIEDCNGKDITGSIELLHASPEDITKSGIIYLPLKSRAQQKDFPNLRKRHKILITNSIIHIEAFGNCFCWEFYDKKNYKGKKQLVWPGNRNKLEFKPGSLRKINCPEDYGYYDDY